MNRLSSLVIAKAQCLSAAMSSNHLHRVNPASILFPLVTDSVYTFASVSPLVIQNDEIVAVTFHSSQPNRTDWIGAYSPANANISLVSPTKFGRCDQASDSGSYLTEGYGTLTFNLTNMRSDVAFHYFTGGFTSPALVASSTQTVTFADVNQPLRNRIVPTGDPNVLTLMWSSASSEVPTLKWGLQSTNYTFETAAVTSTIGKDALCGGVASTFGWRDLGLIHSVNITGILDNDLSSKRIYYSFGDSKTNNFSPENVFQVPPRAGSQPSDHYTTQRDELTQEVPTIPNRPTRVVLMADLGVGASDSTSDTKVFSEACIPAVNTTKSIGHRVLQGDVDAVLLSGDLSYANGYLSNWEFFLDSLAPIAGGSLFLSTVGNHESDWQGSQTLYQGHDSGGECGLSTDLLPMPSPANKLQPWWSYDIGLIHFVGMSTEHTYAPHTEQYHWLKHDLASVNRSVTPWIVFTGHRPAYVDSQFCCGWGIPEHTCNGACSIYSDVAVMQQLQQYIDPLLLKYQVNLAFAGHFHNVQRQGAVYQNKLVQNSVNTTDEHGNVIHVQHNPQATVHMVIGSAGNGPTYSNMQYEWSEASWDNMYGYAVVTAVNSTYLQWEFINSATDEVVDRLVITQNFSTWKIPKTGDLDYDPQAQLVIVIIGTVIVFVSLIGAYIHHRRTKRALQLINGHQLLDQTEHSPSSGSPILQGAQRSSNQQRAPAIVYDSDGVV